MCLQSGSKEITSSVVLAFSCLFGFMGRWHHSCLGVLYKSSLKRSSQMSPRFVTCVILYPFNLALKISHHKGIIQNVEEESRKTVGSTNSWCRILDWIKRRKWGNPSFSCSPLPDCRSHTTRCSQMLQAPAVVTPHYEGCVLSGGLIETLPYLSCFWSGYFIMASEKRGH